MILVMAYAALLSACFAAAAAALEPICRALRAPTRWAWVWALALTLVATGAVMLLPSEAPEEVVVATAAAEVSLVAAGPSAPAAVLGHAGWERAGFAAAVIWGAASLLLLLALVAGAWRLRRERRQAGRSHVQGHFVLLTDGVGPAVAGVTDPVALIPRWVLELDDVSQRLLLAHEMEHVRARDSAVLVFGAVMAALLPWNPLVWWMLRRLRLAVEVDCDQRVLAGEAGVRRYAELLLMTARMPSEHARALVAGLGENESDLERRIVAMTESAQPSLRPMLSRAPGPALLAAALIFAACETPRPDPVGPSALGLEERPVTALVDSSAGEWILHELPARAYRRQGGSLIDEVELKAEQPHYHLPSGELVLPHEQRLLRADEVEVKASAVRRKLPLVEQELRVVPPQPPVRLRANPEMPERKKKAAANLSSDHSGPTLVLRDTSRAVELRAPSARTSTLPLEVQVLSSEGRVLATEHHKSPPTNPQWVSRLDPREIESIEVVKGAIPCLARSANAPEGCHRVTITLKPGVLLRTR